MKWRTWGLRCGWLVSTGASTMPAVAQTSTADLVGQWAYTWPIESVRSSRQMDQKGARVAYAQEQVMFLQRDSTIALYNLWHDMVGAPQRDGPLGGPGQWRASGDTLVLVGPNNGSYSFTLDGPELTLFPLGSTKAPEERVAVLRRFEPEPAATPVVFDSVNVVDVERGTLLPVQRVVIVGFRITAMGSARAVPIPQAARVINARGKYLMPGLWDMHAHPSLLAPDIFYPLFVANGVTGFRDAWSHVPLDTLVQWRREILAGTRVGPPRQLLAGPKISSVDHYRDAEWVVDSLKAAGANFLKGYGITPELAAAAARAGIPFGGHIDETMIISSKEGASILDHVGGYPLIEGSDTFCTAAPATLDSCRAFANYLKRNGTWLVPTLIISNQDLFLEKFTQEFWSSATVLRRYMRPRHGPVPDSLNWLFGGTGGRSLRVQAQAGVPLLAGTDVSSAPGFALHTELELYVAGGMTPAEALQTATLNPARLLHGTDSLGTVAPGKLADLVLLDANPLDAITNTLAIQGVMAHGRYFDRGALDSLLASAKAAFDRMGGLAAIGQPGSPLLQKMRAQMLIGQRSKPSFFPRMQRGKP